LSITRSAGFSSVVVGRARSIFLRGYSFSSVVAPGPLLSSRPSSSSPRAVPLWPLGQVIAFPLRFQLGCASCCQEGRHSFSSVVVLQSLSPRRSSVASSRFQLCCCVSAFSGSASRGTKSLEFQLYCCVSDLLVLKLSTYMCVWGVISTRPSPPQQICWGGHRPLSGRALSKVFIY